jgi:hypothetical protein
MRKTRNESGIVYGNGKTMLLVSLAAAVLALFSGCATMENNPSVNRIVQMSREGVPPQTIIDEMRKNHSVYWLDNDKLAELNRQGVSADVTDYMRTSREDAKLRAWERHQYWETQTWDPVSGSYLF